MVFEQRKREREALKRIRIAQAKKDTEVFMQQFDAEAEKMATDLNVSVEDAKLYLLSQKKVKQRADQILKLKEKLAKLQEAAAEIGGKIATPEEMNAKFAAMEGGGVSYGTPNMDTPLQLTAAQQELMQQLMGTFPESSRPKLGFSTEHPRKSKRGSGLREKLHNPLSRRNREAEDTENPYAFLTFQ